MASKYNQRMQKNKKILVLSSADTPGNKELNQQFVSRIQALAGDDYEIVWAMHADLAIQMGDDWQVRLFPDNELIDEYDLVYFKSYYRYSEIAVSVVEYLQHKNILFMCQELESYISFSKLSQYAKLTRAGLRIPKSLFVAKKHLGVSFDLLVSTLGSPFVLKAIDAKGGDLNFLIDTQQKFDQSLEQSQGVELIAQAFVANQGDMRILILGNQIKLVIHRKRLDDSTHLNNTSQGAAATELDPSELSEETRGMALKAAQILKREIAGVDIMLEEGTNLPFVLEINASPQVASGALTDRKIELYHQLFMDQLEKKT